MIFCGEEAIRKFDITKMERLREAIALGLVKQHYNGYELTLLGLAVWAAEKQANEDKTRQ